MGSVISVNGKLHSVYKKISTTEDRSDGYKPVRIGQPLIIRYLNFFLKHDTNEEINELMISTFVKTEETKKAGAEAINYYNPNAEFINGEFPFPGFGGALYGHPLIYYTKSYLGESIFLTTRVMELDRIDKDVVKAIKAGIGTVAALPAFAEFLPYAAGLSVGVSLFTNILNFFNKDDEIIKGHDLELTFGLKNVSLLQSGRYVCVPKIDSNDLLDDKYKLDLENKLIDTKTNEEYRDNSYFVFQIDSKKNKKLNDFDYYLCAADLLGKTNRREGAADTIKVVVDIFKSYNDIEAIKEIDDLETDADDEETKKLIKAYHNSMSEDVRKLYKSKVKEIITDG